MKENRKNACVRIRFTEHTQSKIVKIAKSKGETVSGLLRHIVENALDTEQLTNQVTRVNE